MANNNYPRREADIFFRAKQRRRKELAKLPFEEKIRILLELQRISSGLRNNKGAGKRRNWDISA